MAYIVFSAAEFSGQTGLDDWRYTAARIEAQFRTGSFGAGAALVAAIADAADVADHHPDVDLRYPDRVHVVLTTHAEGRGVTDRDISLAQTISALAVARGAHAEPLSSQVTEIAIDALDVAAVLPFWRAVLGYVDGIQPYGDGQIRAVVDPQRIGPTVWFQQMEVARPQRNRVHLDVIVARDEADERLAAALAAGGVLLTDAYARAFWVLADPEGNEACICTCEEEPDVAVPS